jgi:hypothetical protein
VTAGTIMHHSKLPLTTWFWAAYLMARAVQRFTPTKAVLGTRSMAAS